MLRRLETWTWIVLLLGCNPAPANGTKVAEITPPASSATAPVASSRPSSSSSASPPAPERELTPSSPIEGFFMNKHFGWIVSGAPLPQNAEATKCRDFFEQLLAEDFAAALAVCQKACDSGDAPSCAIVGEWLLMSKGNESADRPLGLSLLKRACQSGSDRVACLILGERLDRGERISVDAAGARAAWKMGCDQGEELSCAALQGRRVQMERTLIYRDPSASE